VELNVQTKSRYGYITFTTKTIIWVSECNSNNQDKHEIFSAIEKGGKITMWKAQMSSSDD
jgi:hypothetical protein